ncbi:ABC transporter ATP-binding protein [Saccharolobus islandicus]|uniref:ABC transporter related n=1 Tax=Saccharolobus islandicus (strain M.16.27) TaxID=427318 RepID=C3N2S9_SACI3|nr:ABC transporter ATP-binding protein [Sulfolobus islandicus]ACP56426.1 ABC transporter related [Sulfolobus islandicus M.16.27]
MIGLYNVSAGYGKAEVIHDMTFEIKENGVYVILGKNGAGKTTTLRVIAGILPVIKGRVIRKGSVGYLSHSFALPNEMTVREALNFFSKVLGGDPDRVIEEFKLSELLDKKIADLSQGQKKRVAIAKLFLKDHEVYLFDEPTENLDPVIASEIRSMITSLSKHKTVIYTSHNLYEARDIGNYVILIDNGRLALYKPISEIKTKEYVVGIRASEDLSKVLDGHYQGEYFIVTLNDPSEVNNIVLELTKRNVKIFEIKEMKNPLEDLLK